MVLCTCLLTPVTRCSRWRSTRSPLPPPSCSGSGESAAGVTRSRGSHSQRPGPAALVACGALAALLALQARPSVAPPPLTPALTPPAQPPPALAAVPAPDVLSSAAAPARRPKRNSFVRHAADTVGRCVVRLDVDRGTGEAEEAALAASRTRAAVLRSLFGRQTQPEPPRERGQGSGFLVSPAALGGCDQASTQQLVLTNAHVVAGARPGGVRVTLADGRAFAAAVLGCDAVSDVALLSVALEGVQSAPMGDSDDTETGDWVIALGCPFGLDSSVTLGIVSSVSRSAADVGVPDRRLRFLQTDAPINPGSSGGPLVNEYAEVIGMSTAVRADSEGIGFALPINAVRAVAKQLLAGQAVPHPFVGVAMEGHVMHGEDGVRVASLMPGSPACAAGLQPGDAVLALDGVPMHSARALCDALQAACVGQELVLRVRRGQEELAVVVVPGDLADVESQVGGTTAAGGFRQL